MEIKKILRFLISGGITATVQLGLMYLLTDIFGFWYIFSLNLAFVAAFFTSFTLQKFWTFKNDNLDRVYKQALLYFAVVLVNLLINNAFVYLLVEKMDAWYIAAQVMAELIIAIESYFVYKKLIFRD